MSELEVTSTGSCRDGCGCSTEPAGVAVAEPAIVCTLGEGERGDRQAEWHGLVSQASGREPIDGGVRLTFPNAAGLAATIADLAQREHGCCGFFDFSVRLTPAGLALEVRAPEAAAEIVDALFA